jgi:hypothetical protein
MNFHCDYCDFNTSNKKDYNKHILTAKHKNRILRGKIAEKNPSTYHCEICDYHTSNKTDYTKHILTAKHKKRISKKKNPKIDEPGSDSCDIITPNHNLILNLLKQNNELQKQIIELSREPKVINYNTNSGNTNNSQLNLNIFLNETCKNALNFTEFIENIQVTYDDLENNVKMGFVDGMTKIIVDNLKQLEINNRPIHCTDVKRETIYVKEEDQWEKDNSKDVLQKGIQEITRKNMCQLTEWREDNPEYDDIETEVGEKSIVLQQNLMAGGKRNEFYPKIIKNIAKETVLDKKRMIE